MQENPTAALVDMGELAGAIAAETHRRAAEAFTLGITWNEERHSSPLHENQKIVLLEALLRVQDGTEAAITHELEQAIPEELRWRFHDDPNVQAVLRMKPKRGK